jgi:sugar/nucleoside kinase (ribokinase family)
VLADTSAEALHLPKGIAAVVFSELDHPDAENIARRLARHTHAVALTRGARGVTLFCAGEIIHVAAEPASEVDPTGAGDAFGIVFGLALSRGETLLDSARVACRLAARVVEGPVLGTLPAAVDELRASALHTHPIYPTQP